MTKFYYFFVLAFIAIGAQAQIALVKDINPGTGNSLPANLFVFDGYVYFAADDAADVVDHGKELWRTNGTITELVADIRTGTSSSSPSFFFNFNSTLFFSANPGSGNVAYSTDGTESGTVDLGLGTLIFSPKEYDGKLYFIKVTESNAIYEFNGTAIQKVANATTGLVENVLGGVFTILNGKALLYMRNDNEDKDNILGSEVGTELYEYDFSTQEYTLVKNIAADDLTNETPNDRIESSGISNMVNLDTKVYFEALGGLWETDGTEVGTIAIPSASTIGGVDNLYAWDGKIFLEGDDGINGDQLYVYNPTAGTTTNISNIASVDNIDHNPSDYCAYDGYLYYSGQDNGADKKSHLFRTNGTTIEQLNSTIIDIDEIVELNGILYFEGEDATGTETTGNELFMLDPATISTAIGDAPIVSVVKVYPNPSKGRININGLESANATYCIYNLAGECVANGQVLNNQINYSRVGIYILQIVDGTSTLTEKITIK